LKTKVAFAAALILGIAAVFGMQHILDTYRKDVVSRQVNMVFADTPLKAGDVIVQNNVSIAECVGRTARVGDIDQSRLQEILGRNLVRNVAAGDVLNEADFYKPVADIDFTSEVPLNYRAITIPVDQVAGVAGLIKPRDRVDVIGTIAVMSSTPGGSRSSMETLTILENVTVLAIDNRTAEHANLPERLRREGRSSYTSVTLSVSPQEARIITLAQAMSQGMLTLALRNPADNSTDVDRVSAEALWDAIGKAADLRQPRKQTPDSETSTLGQ